MRFRFFPPSKWTMVEIRCSTKRTSVIGLLCAGLLASLLVHQFQLKGVDVGMITLEGEDDGLFESD